MNPLERRVQRLEIGLRALGACVAVFIALHGLIIPLLPKLFDKAPEVTVGALVLGVVLLIAWATRRGR